MSQVETKPAVKFSAFGLEHSLDLALEGCGTERDRESPKSEIKIIYL